MLYLSSYRLGRHAHLLHTPQRRGRAAIIGNALDAFGTTRLRNWDREAADLAHLGYTATELDLRRYFGDVTSLAQHLEQYDLVWVVGGNAFVLARAMTASGFIGALPAALDRGLVYAGYSAEACVAGPDLQGIHLMDTGDDLPAGYDPLMPADTLRLVPFRIVPHWRSDHPETARADAAARWLARSGLDYRVIRDGEVVVVDDGGEIAVQA